MMLVFESRAETFLCLYVIVKVISPCDYCGFALVAVVFHLFYFEIFSEHSK